MKNSSKVTWPGCGPARTQTQEAPPRTEPLTTRQHGCLQQTAPFGRRADPAASPKGSAEWEGRPGLWGACSQMSSRADDPLLASHVPTCPSPGEMPETLTPCCSLCHQPLPSQHPGAVPPVHCSRSGGRQPRGRTLRSPTSRASQPVWSSHEKGLSNHSVCFNQ